MFCPRCKTLVPPGTRCSKCYPYESPKGSRWKVKLQEKILLSRERVSFFDAMSRKSRNAKKYQFWRRKKEKEVEKLLGLEEKLEEKIQEKRKQKQLKKHPEIADLNLEG